jgi:amino acid transporter
MSKQVNSTTVADEGLKPQLGLVGITINAMALIAPGAFFGLLTSYNPKGSQPQYVGFGCSGNSDRPLTASCYATLSKAYPEAGAGSSYYYAEAAIIAKEEHKYFRFARLAKFITGWAAHLTTGFIRE